MITGWPTIPMSVADVHSMKGNDNGSDSDGSVVPGVSFVCEGAGVAEKRVSL